MRRKNRLWILIALAALAALASAQALQVGSGDRVGPRANVGDGPHP